MITITRKNPKQFAKDTISQLPVCERADLNLFRHYDDETIYFAGFRSGKAETLPLQEVWEKEHNSPISSIYTEDRDSKKYCALRQVDRVLVHTSPEDFNLERRVCYPGEILSFGRHNQNGTMPPSNGSHCVGENEQYQIIVSSNGNIIVRTVEQYKINTNPQIQELSYLNLGNNSGNSMDSTRIFYLKQVLDYLPGFIDINLLTEKEHGREIRVIVPNCKVYLIDEALKQSKYNKISE